MNMGFAQGQFQLENTPAHSGQTVTIGGLPIAVTTYEETAAFMLDAAERWPRGVRPLFFTSANGEVISRARTDATFAQALAQADHIVADGQPMVIASRFVCAHALPERVATTDLFHYVARRAEQTGQSFYMLGASAEENARALAAVRAAYPKLKLLGGHHGYEKGNALDRKLKEINDLAPDVLWLSLGVPYEQHFVLDHGHKLDNVGLIKTSGGLFNFLSGTRKRSPRWAQNMGLEWAFRVILEPRRLFWRYLTTNPHALYLILAHSR